MTVIEQRTYESIQRFINFKMKDVNQIDWEHRRYEIAKDTLNGMVSSLPQPHDSQTTVEELAKLSVRYADVLIQELKVVPK